MLNISTNFPYPQNKDDDVKGLSQWVKNHCLELTRILNNLASYNAVVGHVPASSTATGLTLDPTTQVLSLTSGYVIPTTANQTLWTNNYNAVVATNHYTGFPNRTDTSLTWTGANHTLTLVCSGKTIWIDGTPYVLSGNLTFQPPAVTGLYWLWITAPGGVPQLNGSTDSIGNGYAGARAGFDQCLVAQVYYNASTGNGIMSEERHYMGRDKWWHESHHETVGAMWFSGGTITPTDTTFSIAQCEFYDEDIEHILSVATKCRILYHNGNANWDWTDNSPSPYLLNGSAMRYNNGNNLADCSTSDHLCMWVYATNNSTYPFMSVMGNAVGNLASARAATPPSFAALPSVESKLLFKLIYRQNASSVSYIELQDFRQASTVGSTFTPTDHTILSNLTVGDSGHTQFAVLAGRAGGQTIYGGTLTTQNLTLVANAADATGSILIGAVGSTTNELRGTWTAGILYSTDLYTTGNTTLGNANTDTTIIRGNITLQDALDTAHCLQFGDNSQAMYKSGAAAIRTNASFQADGGFVIPLATKKTTIMTAATSDWTLTLPVDGGTNGYVLGTNGSGTTSWISPPLPALTVNYAWVGNGSNVATATALSGITVGNATNATTATTAGTANALNTANSYTVANMAITTQLAIKEGGASPTKFTYFQGGDQTIDLTYTLPTAYPASSGMALVATTAGVMSWAAVALPALTTNYMWVGDAGNAASAGPVGGDLTCAFTVGTGGPNFTIGAQKVGVAKMTSSATSRVFGRITAGAGAGEELTGANINTITNTLDKTTLGAGMSDYLTILPWNNSSATGTWVIALATSFVLGSAIYNSSHANNDQIDYLASFSGGTYSIRIVYRRDTNRPILDFLLDGTSKATQDSYGATSDALIWNITGIAITAGSHTISIKVSNKNGSSSDYYASFSSIGIWRTA